jgi:hypothetical protein
MQQFRIVYSAVKAVIAFICLAVLHNYEWLSQYLGARVVALIEMADDRLRYVSLGLVVAFLTFLFRTSDKLADTLIEKVPGLSALLRRFLGRHNYVEGDWPLIVVNSKTRELLLYGFLTIGYKGGELHVEGADWKPSGELAWYFESIRSTMEGNVLRYFYKQGLDLTQPDMRGYTEIFFFPTTGAAQRHAGEFLDKVNEIPMRFYAKRLPGGPFKRRLKSLEARKAAAKAFWAELEPRLPEVLARERIQTDWL